MQKRIKSASTRIVVRCRRKRLAAFLRAAQQGLLCIRARLVALESGRKGAVDLPSTTAHDAVAS